MKKEEYGPFPLHPGPKPQIPDVDHSSVVNHLHPAAKQSSPSSSGPHRQLNSSVDRLSISL